MRRIIGTLLVALILLLWSIGAWAKDQPKVGLTMGYPSAIGVLWQAAERVALRPEFTATRGSSEGLTTDPIVGTSGTSTPSDNWQVGVGLSALFYLTHDGG